MSELRGQGKQFEQWKEEARKLAKGELHRHASVSRNNRHKCKNCFCCAAMAVEDEQAREQAQETIPCFSAMQSEEWQVYMRPGSTTYCYVTDGINIAYVQWGSMCTQGVSTVHKPDSNVGTGFKLAEQITLDSVRAAMHCVAPSWASKKERESVRKYRDWNEFQRAGSFNGELVRVVFKGRESGRKKGDA